MRYNGVPLGASCLRVHDSLIASREYEHYEELPCVFFSFSINLNQFDEMYEGATDYRQCSVIQFMDGSIIISYSILFTANTTEDVTSIENTIAEELQDPNGTFSQMSKFDSSSLHVQGIF